MNNNVKRITHDAIMLALLCALGMFSISLGTNIKLSLQFLVVIIICFVTPKLVDKLIITGLYLLLGLFLPIYAGFNSGITPTFGYVISFVVCTVPFHFINKSPIKIDWIRMTLAAFVALLVVYLIGTLFMMFYLSLPLGKVLLISVVPYLPFDFFKIALAVLIMKTLPKKITQNLQ